MLAGANQCANGHRHQLIVADDIRLKQQGIRLICRAARQAAAVPGRSRGTSYRMIGRIAPASLKIPIKYNRIFRPGSTGVRYHHNAGRGSRISPPRSGGNISTAMRTDTRISRRRAVSLPARIEITIGSPPSDRGLVTDLSVGDVRL